MKIREASTETKTKPWKVEGVEWREVKLEEFFEIVRGGSPRPIKQYLTDSPDGINWIKIGDAEEEDKFISKTKEKIIKDGIKKSRVVYPGDLLLTNSMTVGKAYISKIKGCIHDGWLLFHPRGDNLYPDYFYYLLNSHILREKFSKKARGGVVRNLNTSLVKSTKIPLPFRNGKPDLETQKKIVEYIEANFSRIDSILEKKKKILAQLDELWGSTLENAFKPREGEEWKEVKLKEVAKIIGGNTAPQNKKFYENGKYLFVRVSDLGAKKNFDPIIDTRDKLNDEGIRKNKLVLAPKNTVVFPKSGAAILTNSRGILGKEAYIVNHLAGVIALENKVFPRYLLFYLSKIDMSKYISPDSSYPSLKLETIRNLKIPFPFRNGKPDLERQKEIADCLDKVYEKIKSIKEKVQFQINQLDEMKGSILNEVFRYDKGN